MQIRLSSTTVDRLCPMAIVFVFGVFIYVLYSRLFVAGH